MTRKQNKILVWLLVWAGLLVAVLYSPVGSPDLYTSRSYYGVVNRGATPVSKDIPNAASVKTGADNTDNSLTPDLPDISNTGSGITSHSAGNYASATTFSQGGSSYAMQTQSYQNSSVSGGGSTGGAVFIASGGSRSSAGTSGGIGMSNGIAGLSTSHTLTNTSVKQDATQTTLDAGGTDPGGDPDPGSLIPVGDGWGLLLLFGACYAALKSRTFIRKRFTFSTKQK